MRSGEEKGKKESGTVVTAPIGGGGGRGGTKTTKTIAENCVVRVEHV